MFSFNKQSTTMFG